MKMFSMGLNGNKRGFRSRIVLGAVALAVVMGLTAAGQAAGEKSSKTGEAPLLRQIMLFNPFTYKSTPVSVPASVPVRVVAGSSQPVMLLSDMTGRPPVRIPYRPALRSPFRPPLVPGTP
jgi:hypothetical protein